MSWEIAMINARHSTAPKHTATERATGSRWARRAPKVGAVAAASAIGLAAFTGSANAAFQSSLTLNAPAGMSAARYVPSLGQSVTFTAVISKTAKNPVLIVDCFQNQVLAYEQRGAVTDTYLLGGTSSDWLTNKGPASCVANVYNLVWSSKYQTYEYMVQAVTTFDATG